jgi:hypothetical protein
MKHMFLGTGQHVDLLPQGNAHHANRATAFGIHHVCVGRFSLFETDVFGAEGAVGTAASAAAADEHEEEAEYRG